MDKQNRFFANKRRMSKGDKLFIIVNQLFLVLVLTLTIYPLIYILSSSLSAPSEVVAGRVWLFPVKFSLEGYKAVFVYKDIWIGYANTLFYTFFGTILNVALTIMAAYPLSRKDFRGRNPIMLIFTLTMFLNGGLIPTYLLVDKLGLVNTRMAMILPTAISVWNVIITRTYFQTIISNELLEASRLDGCSDIKFIVKIVIPLSGAIIAVITLFYAVSHWNSFFPALIYLRDNSLMPLQMKLRSILVLNQIDTNMFNGNIDITEMSKRANLRESLKYSLIVVASLPVLCIYPFAQKYFIKGVMIGSIKG